MVLSRISLTFSLIALAAQSAVADIPLIIPGFDEQPLSVSELGVDSNGDTTWQLVAGTPTGTFTAAEFSGTAILVEGPSNAYVSYSADGLENVFSCSFGANDEGTCNEIHAYQNPTAFGAFGSGGMLMTALTPFLVQYGEPTATVPNGGGSFVTSKTNPASPPGQTSGISGGGGSSTTDNQNNGGLHLRPSVVATLLAGLIGAFMFA